MKLKDSVILILVVIIAIAGGVFVGYKLGEKASDVLEPNDNQLENNENNNGINNNEGQNKKESLTSEELEYLQEYINKPEINPFIIMGYSNPNEILIDTLPADKFGDNADILRYAFFLSDYSIRLTEEQLNMIEYPVGTEHKLISGQSMIKFLKETSNVDVTEEKIMEIYKDYYNEKLNSFIFRISDSIYFEYNIESSYKIGNKYYLTLDKGGRKVTLIKENGNYCFYSCEGLWS